jgi:hypothetical protein
MSDDVEFPKARDFLADARRDFPQFYLLASLEEEILMDSLVMAHAAIVVGMNAPRTGVVAEVRDPLEKVTDGAERLFTQLRELMRTSPAFQRVSVDERCLIEKVLFHVRVAE